MVTRQRNKDKSVIVIAQPSPYQYIVVQAIQDATTGDIRTKLVSRMEGFPRSDEAFEFAYTLDPTHGYMLVRQIEAWEDGRALGVVKSIFAGEKIEVDQDAFGLVRFGPDGPPWKRTEKAYSKGTHDAGDVLDLPGSNPHVHVDHNVSREAQVVNEMIESKFSPGLDDDAETHLANAQKNFEDALDRLMGRFNIR